MTHRCTYGQFVTEYFEATRNQDLSEGRGAEVSICAVESFDFALRQCRGASVQGGDGNVNQVMVYLCADDHDPIGCRKVLFRTVARAYTGHGKVFHPDFDPRMKDPEYVEYVRLQKKFG